MPAGAIMLNASGATVRVNENRIASCLAQNYQWKREFITRTRPGNVALLHRPAGGWGDVIAMRPTIEQLAAKHTLTVSLPKSYHFLINDLPLKCEDYDSIRRTDYYDVIYDMWCPANVSEAITGFDPKISRVEAFAQAANVEARTPTMAKPTPTFLNKTEKFVGIVPKSKHKSKNIPPETLAIVAEQLLNQNINVITIDHDTTIPGTTGFTGKSMAQAHNLIGELDCLVTPDTGTMWSALAMGIPVVAVFGPTNGKLTLKHFDPALYRLVENQIEHTCKQPCYYSDQRGYCCTSYSEAVIGECMEQYSPEEIVGDVCSLIS